jgi:methionyl aminopeptidase
MAIRIKTRDEVQKLRAAGQLAADVLDYIAPFVQPGISTEELNRLCHDFMINTQGVIPAPLNYRGFPKSICTSINHTVCHGIPGPKKLKSGDIINIDITVIHEGYHGDTSKMFEVGEVPIRARRLNKLCQEALYLGILAVRPGARMGDIGHAIQKHAESQGLSVVQEFCGHGIGREFHEDPQVLHYGKPETGLVLQEGMVFTIEPMLNLGKRHVKILPDGWTAVTKDHSLSAQWEHMVAVTTEGFEVLTLRSEEPHDLRDAVPLA